jgi:hypothetical protein
MLRNASKCFVLTRSHLCTRRAICEGFCCSSQIESLRGAVNGHLMRVKIVQQPVENAGTLPSTQSRMVDET